jgi:phage terminase large subunit GpA-like protein
MMDAVYCHDRVCFMTSSQIGKTLMLKAILGYFVSEEPGPILVLQPTLDMAETFSKDRLAPMFRDTPVLHGLIKDARSRDSNNTILKKNFPGGHLTIVGANSPTGLSARPIRFVLGDEIDRFPVSAGTEGDPISLAIKRTQTFHNRKILLVSTPTDQGNSRIEKEFNLSDQRFFHVPCPECGQKQKLEWENLKFEEGKEYDAEYECKFCNALIGEDKKSWMVANGEWVAENPSGKFPGFHISVLYLHWVKWSEVAEEFNEKKTDVQLLKTFYNTSLGRTFINKGDAPEWERVYDLRESYPVGSIPEPVRFLTAAVDVQKNRLELELKGWTRTGESYSIEHIIFPGEDPFDKLDEYLNRTWRHPSGVVMKLLGLAIDTGGEKTQRVYMWCSKHPKNLVYAFKGKGGIATAAVSTPSNVDVNFMGKRVSNGVQLWTVGVSLLKEELYSRLRYRPNEAGEFPRGYMHFPEYPPEWFKQLTSENMRWVIRGGRKTPQWILPPGVSNEALDLNVYNRALAIVLGIDRLTETEWDNIDRQFSGKVQNESKPVSQGYSAPRRRSGGRIVL